MSELRRELKIYSTCIKTSTSPVTGAEKTTKADQGKSLIVKLYAVETKVILRNAASPAEVIRCARFEQFAIANAKKLITSTTKNDS